MENLAALMRSRRTLIPSGAGFSTESGIPDLVRAREAAKQDQLRACHRLGKFLLRRGMLAVQPRGRNELVENLCLGAPIGSTVASDNLSGHRLAFFHRQPHLFDLPRLDLRGAKSWVRFYL